MNTRHLKKYEVEWTKEVAISGIANVTADSEEQAYDLAYENLNRLENKSKTYRGTIHDYRIVIRRIDDTYY